MGKRRKVPEDLMGAILNEGYDADDGGRGFPWSNGPSVADGETDFSSSAGEGIIWEDRPERVGVAFNLSKQVIVELEKLRQELRLEGDVRPSRSEVVEAALRIAVEDFRGRGEDSDVAGRLDGRRVDRGRDPTGEAVRTTRLSVDEAGFIVETTYNETGGIVDEEVIAAVTDLPVSEEYVDDQGRLVSVMKDKLGNTFEQVMDEQFNALETRLLPDADR